MRWRQKERQNARQQYIKILSITKEWTDWFIWFLHTQMQTIILKYNFHSDILTISEWAWKISAISHLNDINQRPKLIRNKYFSPIYPVKARMIKDAGQSIRKSAITNSQKHALGFPAWHLQKKESWYSKGKGWLTMFSRRWRWIQTWRWWRLWFLGRQLNGGDSVGTRGFNNRWLCSLQ